LVEFPERIRGARQRRTRPCLMTPQLSSNWRPKQPNEARISNVCGALNMSWITVVDLLRQPESWTDAQNRDANISLQHVAEHARQLLHESKL